eukprot:s6590_g1.t1
MLFLVKMRVSLSKVLGASQGSFKDFATLYPTLAPALAAFALELGTDLGGGLSLLAAGLAAEPRIGTALPAGAALALAELALAAAALVWAAFAIGPGLMNLEWITIPFKDAKTVT